MPTAISAFVVVVPLRDERCMTLDMRSEGSRWHTIVTIVVEAWLSGHSGTMAVVLCNTVLHASIHGA